MAYFVRPPDLVTAQNFIHADLNAWTELALNPYGVDGLVMVANNPGVLKVSDDQTPRGGLIYFKVFGSAIGYSFLDACVGRDGPSWGKTQVIVGQGSWATPPKKVAQVTSWTCWAAAMESYLSVRPYGARWTQNHLAVNYGIKDRGELPGLPEPGFDPSHCAKQLYEDLGIRWEGVSGHNFTFDYIQKQLKANQYVLLTYTAGHLADGSEYAHVVVAYACRSEPAPYGQTVSVMDPNQGGSYDTWPISHFQQFPRIIVAWQP